MPRNTNRNTRPEINRQRQVGRPRKRVSARVVKQLAEAQLTNLEIAKVLNCSVDTLARRFGEKIREWRAAGVGSARRELYRVAMRRGGSGKVSALIFFLKNYGRLSDWGYREELQAKEILTGAIAQPAAEQIRTLSTTDRILLRSGVESTFSILRLQIEQGHRQ